MDTGRILHELIHVLGFFHMHSASNRDKFVGMFYIKLRKCFNYQNFII